MPSSGPVSHKTASAQLCRLQPKNKKQEKIYDLFENVEPRRHFDGLFVTRHPPPASSSPSSLLRQGHLIGDGRKKIHVKNVKIRRIILQRNKKEIRQLENCTFLRRKFSKSSTWHLRYFFIFSRKRNEIFWSFYGDIPQSRKKNNPEKKLSRSRHLNPAILHNPAIIIPPIIPIPPFSSRLLI